MKPGCLIKSLIVSTVLIAVVLYIAKNHSDEYIKTPLIKMALNFTLNSVKNDLAAISGTESKDSLSAALESYVSDLKNQKVIKINDLKEIADSLGIIIIDKQITALEASNFINFLNSKKSK